jgi:hypothetical protein
MQSNGSEDSFKNDHFSRILGSGTTRLEIFEYNLGRKVGPQDFAQKFGKI